MGQRLLCSPERTPEEPWVGLGMDRSSYRRLLGVCWGLEPSPDTALIHRNLRLPVHKPGNHLELLFLNTLF